MVPITRNHLLMVSVPVAILLINYYLWPKKKKICAPKKKKICDPGDTGTDKKNPCVETKLNSSPRSESAENKTHTNNCQISLNRSLSSPIPINLPKEKQESNSFVVSIDELEAQIDRCISSVKKIDPFLEITKQNNKMNTYIPRKNSNRLISVSPIPDPMNTQYFEESRTFLQRSSEEETINLDIEESSHPKECRKERTALTAMCKLILRDIEQSANVTERQKAAEHSLNHALNCMEITDCSPPNRDALPALLAMPTRKRQNLPDEGSRPVGYSKKNKNDEGNQHIWQTTFQRPVCPAENFFTDNEYLHNGVLEFIPREIEENHSLRGIEDRASPAELSSSVCNGVLKNDSEAMECPPASERLSPVEVIEEPSSAELPLGRGEAVSENKRKTKEVDGDESHLKSSEESSSHATQCPPPEVLHRLGIPTEVGASSLEGKPSSASSPQKILSRKNRRKLKKLTTVETASINQVPTPAEVGVSDTTNNTVIENRLLDRPSSSGQTTKVDKPSVADTQPSPSNSVEQVPTPAEVCVSDTRNITTQNNEVQEPGLPDEPTSWDEMVTHERSAEIQPSSSMGAIPKQSNKKKKFVKLNCELKDLSKKLREVGKPSSSTKQDTWRKNKSFQPNTVKHIPPNENVVQKSRNDSGCEREDVSGRDSRRQSTNVSPTEEMLKRPSINSSLVSLVGSVRSNDSGKGCSDIITPPPQTKPPPEEDTEYYGFVIPIEFAGKLIGIKGSFIKSIRDITSASLVVNEHPSDAEKKLCIVNGTPTAISKTMQMVEKRLKKVSIEKYEFEVPQPKPVLYSMELPCGVNVETHVSYIDNAEHYHVQQFTHPAFINFAHVAALSQIEYEEGQVPLLKRPIKDNSVCMARIGDHWMRVCVESSNEETETAYVKSLDFGGYETVPLSALRWMTYNYYNIPFQATECYLSNVTPTNGKWSKAALDVIRELSFNRIVYTHIVSYREDGIPLVNCQVLINNMNILFNWELVKRGHARWIVPPTPVNVNTSEQETGVVETHT